MERDVAKNVWLYSSLQVVLEYIDVIYRNMSGPWNRAARPESPRCMRSGWIRLICVEPIIFLISVQKGGVNY